MGSDLVRRPTLALSLGGCEATSHAKPRRIVTVGVDGLQKHTAARRPRGSGGLRTLDVGCVAGSVSAPGPVPPSLLLGWGRGGGVGPGGWRWARGWRRGRHPAERGQNPEGRGGGGPARGALGRPAGGWGRSGRRQRPDSPASPVPLYAPGLASASAEEGVRDGGTPAEPSAPSSVAPGVQVRWRPGRSSSKEPVTLYARSPLPFRVVLSKALNLSGPQFPSPQNGDAGGFAGGGGGGRRSEDTEQGRPQWRLG